MKAFGAEWVVAAVVGVLAASAVPDRAEAAVVDYSFTGIWTSVTDLGGPGTPALGGSFSALVSLDTDLPDLCADTSNAGCYSPPDGGLSITTAGHIYSTTSASSPRYTSTTGNPDNDLWVAEQFVNQGAVDSVPTPISDSLSLRIFLSGTKAADSILPVFLEFLGGNVTLDYRPGGTGGFIALGTVTGFGPVSAVALPAALPLFATGVGGLLGYSWRRKRRAIAAS